MPFFGSKMSVILTGSSGERGTSCDAHSWCVGGCCADDGNWF